ncbi:MAG: hypothetical protein GTO46_05370, partial [Gemmatimonadetes bacterium]|nr:hypothetical protein [Gemmatimonadota bacterium]
RQHFAPLTSPESPRERPLFVVPFHDETEFAIATDPEATFNSVGVYWKQSPQEEVTIGDYRRSLVEALYNQMFNQRLFELTQQADPPFLGA